MNVEYVNLSDGTTLVTDENGKINKRNTVDEDILILENKIEKIEDEEKNSIKKIEFIKKAATKLKKMLLAIPILITIAPLAGYGIGSLANGLDIAATAGALLGLISSGLVSISIASIFTVFPYLYVPAPLVELIPVPLFNVNANVFLVNHI